MKGNSAYFIVAAAVLAAIGGYFDGVTTLAETVTAVLIALGYAGHKYDTTPDA